MAESWAVSTPFPFQLTVNTVRRGRWILLECKEQIEFAGHVPTAFWLTKEQRDQLQSGVRGWHWRNRHLRPTGMRVIDWVRRAPGVESLTFEGVPFRVR